MRDLSVLIPARNEQFLNKTIESILENIELDTEVIVVLDGQWGTEGLIQNDRVKVIFNPESVGQRAATNQAARVSRAKYIMKLDAHCAVDRGFDRKLIAEMEPNMTMIPRMFNLHAFDWKCLGCGDRSYQGPRPTECGKCDKKEFEQLIVWKPRLSRKTDFMRFDRTLKFQYWGDYEKRPESKSEIADLMCSLGACWLMERSRYWELGGLDESHGSWGQMGVEIACKTWLSGGRQVVNKKTWFSHMFRTQPGFGFPYPMSGSDQEKARDYSRDLWFGGKWDKAIRPLSWIIEKFDPPEWEVSKGIIYYTGGGLEEKIFLACQKQLKKAAGKIPIVSSSLTPIDFGQNICLPLQKGYLTMAKQILAALEQTKGDIVYFTEHDVLYHPSHFDFIPPDREKFYYNINVWKVRSTDGHALHYDCKQLSGLVAYRDILIEHFRERVRRIEAEGYTMKMGFEPGTHNRKERIDDRKSGSFLSLFPNVDIRHSENLTPSRWKKEQFRDQRYTAGWTESDEIPGWGLVKGNFDKFIDIKD